LKLPREPQVGMLEQTKLCRTLALSKAKFDTPALNWQIPLVFGKAECPGSQPCS